MLVVLAIIVAVVVARRDTVLEATGIARRRRRPRRDDFRPEGLDEDAPPLKRAGIIVNPTKFTDLDAVRARVTTTCLAQGWGEPIWLETNHRRPGYRPGATSRRGGRRGDLPLGGDGTVRAVATALVGTETPLGPFPGGTGNLLARNLDLPFDSHREGPGRRVDGPERPHRRRSCCRWTRRDSTPSRTSTSSSSWPASAWTRRSWPARRSGSRPAWVRPPTSCRGSRTSSVHSSRCG